MERNGRIRLAAILLLFLLLSVSLVSCTEDEPTRTCIGIVPAYRGDTITDTHHEFTKDEFYVYATFDDGTDGEVEDYEFTLDGMQSGYFRLTFTYQDVSNGCLVPCEAPIYPSDYAVQEQQQGD